MNPDDQVVLPLYIAAGLIAILTIYMVIMGIQETFGEERECGDIKWQSEGHDDNKAKDKLESDSYKKDICQVSKDVDHMKTKGEIDDWTQFKRSQVFATATQEQRDCLKEYFDSPDDGEKALQAYELSYCGYDDD